jgi:hypothetical protein
MGANIIAGLMNTCSLFWPLFFLSFFIYSIVDFRSEFDKAEAPSSVKKAKPKQSQQQKQQPQNPRETRARKRSALAEDYFPSASDL